MSGAFKDATGYTREELSFALSWGVAAMTDDYIELQYEDTKDPGNPGEDAEQARDIMRELMRRLDAATGATPPNTQQ